MRSPYQHIRFTLPSNRNRGDEIPEILNHDSRTGLDHRKRQRLLARSAGSRKNSKVTPDLRLPWACPKSPAKDLQKVQ